LITSGLILYKHSDIMTESIPLSQHRGMLGVLLEWIHAQSRNKNTQNYEEDSIFCFDKITIKYDKNMFFASFILMLFVCWTMPTHTVVLWVGSSC